MEETNEFNQRHPFRFRIDRINHYIHDLIEEKLYDLALDHIKIIREKYVVARNLREIPQGKSFVYGHFQAYWKEQMDLAMIGKTYPDGSKDKVIYELNELQSKIEGVSNKKPISEKEPKQKISQKTPEKNGAKKNGIILFYLMYYGSDEYPQTTNKTKLNEYLEKLELDGSGAQAYNKGIVHLTEDESRGKTRRYGVFTKQEFLDSVEFLKGKDEKAYINAMSDFNEYCAEEINSEGDKHHNFFKK